MVVCSIVRRVEVHDHLCIVYEDQRDLLDFVIPYIEAGLEANEKCLYIAEQQEAKAVITRLKELNFAVDSFLESGQLVFLTAGDAYLQQQHFSQEAMVTFFSEEGRQAKKQGYAALRISGDLSALTASKEGIQRLISYENYINRFLFPDNPVIALCRYNKQHIAPKVLKEVIEAHPYVVWQGRIHENPYFLPQGVSGQDKVDVWLGNMHQYTRIKGRFKQNISQSESRYKTIFNNVNDALFVCDFSSNDLGRFLEVNAAATHLLGYDKAELLKLSLKTISKSQGEYFYRKILKDLREEGQARFEAQYLTKQEAMVTADVNALVFSYKNNKAVLSVARDISQRNKMEEALQESSERYADLVNNMSSLVITLAVVSNGEDFRVTSFNRSKHLPLPISQLVGQRLSTIKIAAADKVLAAARAVYHDGQPKRVKEIHVKTASTSAWYTLYVYRLSNDELVVLADDISRQKQVEQQLLSALEQLKVAQGKTVEALARTTERSDPYTAGHQFNVAYLATEIAQQLGLSQERIEAVGIAAKLHDVGKISVPAKILNKPSQLTKLEWRYIKNHPIISSEIIKGIPFSSPVEEFVMQHHERLDGSGYPRGLKADQIHLEAKIIAVADTVEAITHHRPYRGAMGLEKAKAELMKYSGIYYDQEVVQACLHICDKQEQLRWHHN